MAIFVLGLIVPLLSIAAVELADGVGYAGGHYESGKYTSISRTWLETGAYGEMRDGEWTPSATRLPGYPVFVGLVYAVFGVDNHLAVVLFQAVMAALCVVFTATAAAYVRPSWRWPAALLVAAFANIGYRASMVMPDLFFTTLVSGVVAACLAAMYGRRPLAAMAVCGVFMGLALLTRPAFMFVPLFALPVVWWSLARYRAMGWRRALVPPALAAGLALVFVVPWLGYTATNFGSATYNLQGGTHALEWLYPCLAERNGCGEIDPDVAAHAAKTLEQRLAEVPAHMRDDPIRLDAVKKEVAYELISELGPVQVVRAAVMSSLKLLAHPWIVEAFQRFDVPYLHFGELPGAGLSGKLASLAGGIATMPSLGVWVLAMALLGLTRAVQVTGLVAALGDRHHRPAALLVLAVGIAVVGVALGIGNHRYRAPAEPLLALLTVMGGHYLLAAWYRWRGMSGAAEGTAAQ